MSDITKVAVLGMGVLGSQIAFQTAYSGFDVTAYDISEDALEQARERFAILVETYVKEVPDASGGKASEARGRIVLVGDLGAAVADADLVIEAAPEVLEIKQALYEKLASLAPDRTIFATNSSTLLPSDLKAFTGRPDRFLALHFANSIWKFNTAEVMGTDDTDPAVFDALIAFASAIGMVPIPMRKEKAGYVLNSLLVPFLNAAADLAAGGYADPHDVDKVWQIATGAPLGPFQIYDMIGLNTPYNILSHGDEHARSLAAWLKENYIDKGKLGIASGEGFYSYKPAD
ncbi:3-hydroxyacyl-CoA dehydrogenase, NAD binding domain protein [Sphingopyxis fribergensis]|uniref:3-hydroxyacyl-CoA dehydrogenase, NAD binding domain protein n=1 Tax=Sphingopyxis fribergensis TaxID=1515612 RepID=A0A0A7PMT8_9SPHN|nr:3-hydroxyacyl-CoA dehydrogenase [Sphingopyxis fribergensis]AJA11314.1 3-hydroxyacyl-CoA dehydrogenase, NAD binding domain protein [Sphingopyxis fribergensis]